MSAPTALSPMPTVDMGSLAAQIVAAPDPAAFISQLVLSVAAQSPTAAKQGQLLSMIKSSCERNLKAVRAALLEAVDEEPGSYDGFVIFSRAGQRGLDYDLLHKRHPAVYDELVKVSSPSLSVKYTG